MWHLGNEGGVRPGMVFPSGQGQFVHGEAPDVRATTAPAPVKKLLSTRLVNAAKAVEDRRATTRTLAEFLTPDRRLGRKERQAIVREALWMLEEAYVHLPQKRAMYAVAPLQQLRAARRTC